MKLDNVIEAWNSQADQYNQWGTLDIEEKVGLAYKMYEEESDRHELNSEYSKENGVALYLNNELGRFVYSVVSSFDGEWWLASFDSVEEAEQWCFDNGYEL